MAEQTRQEQREERRQRIEARAHREQDRERRRRRRALMRVGIPIGIGALVLAAVLFFAVREATAPVPGEPVPDEGRNHVEPGTPLTYNTYPPASGPHYPTTARWSYNDTPVQAAFWVHNLEHGGVVFLYKCPEDCTRLKQQLRELFNSLPPSNKYRYVKAVIAPDDKIESQIVALAWGRRMALEQYDDRQLRRFYQALVDRGPEDAG